MEGHASQPPGPNWWSRNWKWVVPVIVVAGLVGVVLAALPLVAIYFFASFFLHTMKTSGGYQEALAAVRANPAALRALGTPIKDGWLPTGNIEAGGSSGVADLAIPISGPDGGGTLYASATRSMGDWHLTMLVLQLKTGERIDLLAGSSP